MNKKETIDHQIKSTWHAVFKMYNQIAAKHDSTQATGFVLLNITKEGTPATKIAPMMGMESTSMSRILRSMEDKNLIYRERDKKDKRIVRIFLTREGVKKRKVAKKVVEGFNELIGSEIPQNKRSVFFEVMESINDTINLYREQNEI